MKKHFSLFVMLFYYINLFGQTDLKKESIDYYFTYQDYVNNTPNKPEKAVITIKEHYPNSFRYDKILSEATNGKIKRGYTIWGIKYNNELYHNLLLTNYEIAQDHAYGKFKIVGKRINVILLDMIKDKKAIGRNGNPYGGSLVAAALYKPVNSVWMDKAGNKYKVLFYDAENPFMSQTYKENVMVRLLTAKDIAEFYNNDPLIIDKLKKGEYYVEDFLEFAEKENK